MTDNPWSHPLFRETTYLVVGVLVFLAIVLFPFRKKHSALVASWASLKSWFFTAPIIFFFLSLGRPWPLIALTAASIMGAKEFFQITGIYHRSSFVWITYSGITGLALAIYFRLERLYDLMPMIVVGALCLVPLIKNQYKNMVQYLALGLFNFFFLGWGFLHMGKIVQMENGPLLAIYIILLTEVCDNIALASSQLLGSKKLADNITVRRTLEGFIVSFLLTIFLAYGMRHLLPDRSEPYWLVSGLIAFLVGSLGDIVLSVIRRDLGVKDRGAFIWGRGTLLDLMDRLIFAAPTFYYAMILLNKVFH